MHGIYQFFKSTIIGGLLILLPIVVLGTLAAWAAQATWKALGPAFHWLPDHSVGGVSLALLFGTLTIIGVCFLAGLVAETALIRFLGDRAEQIALSIPGYALMKSVGTSLVGIEGKHAAKTVLVQLTASWQLGFLMETLADGRHVVFIPGVPKALVGSLHLFAPERVQVLDMPVSRALDVLGRLGVGLREVQRVSS